VVLKLRLSHFWSSSLAPWAMGGAGVACLSEPNNSSIGCHCGSFPQYSPSSMNCMVSQRCTSSLAARIAQSPASLVIARLVAFALGVSSAWPQCPSAPVGIQAWYSPDVSRKKVARVGPQLVPCGTPLRTVLNLSGSSGCGLGAILSAEVLPISMELKLASRGSAV